MCSKAEIKVLLRILLVVFTFARARSVQQVGDSERAGPHHGHIATGKRLCFRDACIDHSLCGRRKRGISIRSQLATGVWFGSIHLQTLEGEGRSESKQAGSCSCPAEKTELWKRHCSCFFLHGRYFVASDYNFDGGTCLLKNTVAWCLGVNANATKARIGLHGPTGIGIRHCHRD